MTLATFVAGSLHLVMVARGHPSRRYRQRPESFGVAHQRVQLQEFAAPDRFERLFAPGQVAQMAACRRAENLGRRPRLDRSQGGGNLLTSLSAMLNILSTESSLELCRAAQYPWQTICKDSCHQGSSMQPP